MAKSKKTPKPNKEYELKPARLATEKRILSLDPGSRNMGIACLGVTGDKIHVIANSIMTHPIASLVDNYHTNLNIYLDEIARWVDLYKPNGFIMERFQSRGSFIGPLVEIVNVMLGAVTTEYRDKPCRLILAATWKAAFQKRFNVELDEVYRRCLTTPHALDATLIGCFGLEAGLRRSLIYSPNSIIKQVESTSCLPLRKPRN